MRFWWAFVLGASGILTAQAQTEPLVTIQGGYDRADFDYAWTITNHHDSPIIHVEFPQYKSSWHLPPDGWTGEMSTSRGIGGRMGTYLVSADDPSRGIFPGASAQFQLGIRPGGTPSAFREVLVRFADGTDVRVKAECPVKEPIGDRYVPLLGLGLIFGLYLLVRAAKRRREATPLT